MSNLITYRAASPAEATAVRRLVRQLAGRAAPPPGMVTRVLLPAALVLLSKVQQAFIAKSRRQASEDGIVWKELSPKTVAARRTTRAELKSFGITGKRVRGFLTPAEDRRWRGIFASRMAAFRAQGMGEGEARARAAANAWAILKAQGAKTKLAVLGGRVVDIGRDTGTLLRSLTPGVRLDPTGRTPPPQLGTAAPAVESQIVDLSLPGRVTVGSTVPYAGKFHAVRPLWPTTGRLPEPWRQAVGAAILRGLVAEAGRAS
ncbi:MAG: hypothetical protein U0804_28720 [Gemmataceae bacterium]